MIKVESTSDPGNRCASQAVQSGLAESAGSGPPVLSFRSPLKCEVYAVSLFRVCDVEVDLRAGELRKDGRITRLQDKPLQLLGMLLRQPHVLLTREQIIEQIWGASRYHHFEDSLNQCVRKLRQALGEKAKNPDILETIPGRGYRLIASVETVNDGLSDKSSNAAQPFSAAPTGDPGEGEQRIPLPRVIRDLANGSRLIGREAELQTLCEAWRAARSGAQRLVLVSGEAGIGKTLLAFAFAHSVSAESSVLLGRCDSEVLVPFGPFVEILQSVVQTCSAATVQHWLALVGGSNDLAQFLPGIGPILGTVAETTPLTTEGRRYRMFEAFTGLLHAISTLRPTLLVLEDMHWADPGSMLLLRHLVRSARSSALCVIVTVSGSEMHQDESARHIFTDLCREPSVSRIALGGLRDQHISRIADDWIGSTAPAALIRVLADSTRGNPLYVCEVLRHVTESGIAPQLRKLSESATIADIGLPTSLTEIICSRLSRLGHDCETLLALATVVGHEFDLSVLESLAGMPEGVLLDEIDSAVQAGVVHEVAGAPGRFSFTHEVIREAVYGRQTIARRMRLHHRVAMVLEAQLQGQASPSELARHFGRAAAFRDAQKAVDYAIQAAELAASCLALEDAAHYYGMALHALKYVPCARRRFGDNLQLHTERGRMFFQVGEWMSAKAEFTAAMEIAASSQDMDLKRCQLLISLAETSFWLMDVAGVRQFASDAQRLAGLLGCDDLFSDAIGWRASAEAADGDVLRAVETDRRALVKGSGRKSFWRARVPLTLYWAGLTLEAAQQASLAVESARESQDAAFLLYALQHQGLALSGSGRYDQALSVFEEARSFGKDCGALPLLARATSMSVAPLLSLGDFEAATIRALEARELAYRVDFEPPIVSAGIDLLLICARSNDLRGAKALLDEVTPAVDKARGWHSWKWQLRLSQARAELALARGDFHEARVAAEHVVEQSRAHHRPKYQALGLATRSRALAGLGSRHAKADARSAVAIARRLADPVVIVDCMAASLELEPNQELYAEVRLLIGRIAAGLSNDEQRSRFVATASQRLEPLSLRPGSLTA